MPRMSLDLRDCESVVIEFRDDKLVVVWENKDNGQRQRRNRRHTSEDDVSPPEPSRRGRKPRNEKSLKDVIVGVLEKEGRINLQRLSKIILDSGFQTDAKNFQNTVRVQLYRLEDEKRIMIWDDGTYSLPR